MSENLEVLSNPKVVAVFGRYPKHLKKQLLHLRELVLNTASERDGLEKLVETLKWGEPSYLIKHGSSLRMDWKEKNPNQYGMYFKCITKLVPTFKIIYKNKFQYEGNRAIVFNLSDKIPETELKHCMSLAFNYHKIKHLPVLGVSY